MKYLSGIIAAAVLFAIGAIGTASARNLAVGDRLDFEQVASPQISPDGRQVIYTRRGVDRMKDRMTGSLWIVDADGSRNRELVRGGNARWSPDGSRIAYIAADKNGARQLFVRWMDAEGNITQITHSQLAPRGFAWTPDGQSIAFVARVPKKPTWKVTLPGRPRGAKCTADPVVIDTYTFRQDRVGYTNTGYDHIFVVPADGGTPRQITKGKWNVGYRAIGAIAVPPTLSWSPDSTAIAFDGLNDPDWDSKWTESHIYVVDVASAKIRQITGGHGNWHQPAFSPDGKSIAFVGFAEWNTTYPMPDLWLIGADGKNQRAIASNMDDGPNGIRWAKNGKGVYFTMGARGNVNVHYAGTNGKLRAVTTGDQVLGLSSFSNNGVAVGVRSRAQEPGDVFRFRLADGGKMKRLTAVNADILKGVELGKVEKITYKSTEGAMVDGWIITPPGFDKTKKYPLYLKIHGGPHGMYNSGFNFAMQEHVANGYVLLYTNPRGSTGYGYDFANAINRAYPGKRDFSDLMAGVDATIAKGYIDTARLFVEGCSGGGILTSWVVSHTDRFKAAVARCTVVDWISMASTTDVAGWAAHFFGTKFWEDPSPWLAHAPVMFVGSINTPVLLMTGTRDLRTPISQAEEFYGALKMRGIPTMLLPMKGEFHGTGSIPSNWMRTQLYIRKWFDRYDPAKQKD